MPLAQEHMWKVLPCIRIRQYDFNAQFIRHSRKIQLEVTGKKGAKNEMADHHFSEHEISFCKGSRNFFHSHCHKCMLK